MRGLWAWVQDDETTVRSVVTLLMRPSTRHVAIAWMIAVAVFTSRFTVSVGTRSLRLEHIVALICAVDLLVVVVNRRRRDGGSAWLKKAKRLPSDVVGVTVVLTSFWILWGAAVSLLHSPAPGKSLTIVLWFGLDLVVALWVASTPHAFRHLTRALAVVAAVFGTASLGIYLLGTATNTQYFGLQVDPTYGGFAVYGASIEANILAGTMCLIGILALANPGGTIPTWCWWYLPMLAPAVIVVSHTRAALVAYALGVAVVAVSRHETRLRVAIMVGLVAPAVLLNGLVSNDDGLAKFAQIFDVSSGTGAFRWERSSTALSEWFHSGAQLTGLGVNSYGQRHIDGSRPGLNMPDYLSNLPLQVLYDTGLVGFTVVLLCVVLVLGAYRQRVTLAIALFVPYLALSIATSSMWLLSTWVFVGLAWAGLRSRGHASATIGLRGEAG